MVENNNANQDNSNKKLLGSYQINGKTYFQRQLVLGQINELLGLVNDLPLTLTPQSILIALGEKVPAALAILLVPEGSTVKDRDLKAIEEDMYFCPVDVLLEVLEDFLSFNRTSWFNDKIAQVKAILNPEAAPTIPEGKSSGLSTSLLGGIF